MREHRIPGSLNQKKGDIEYNGHIRIDGDVRGYINIKAAGDINIGGDCENTNLTAGGSINVGGNITGSTRNLITATDDISLGGIRDVGIRCNGNLSTVIRVENSNINICGQLSGPKTILRDCHVTALKGILLHSVECSGPGSSILTVGVNFQRIEDTAFLQEKLDKKEFELQHLLDRLGPMLQRAVRERDYGLKLGPDIDTEVSRCRNFDKEISVLRKDIQKIKEHYSDEAVACIAVNRAIQSGTQIYIKRYFKMATSNINGPVSFIANDEKNCIIKEQNLLLHEV